MRRCLPLLAAATAALAALPAHALGACSSRAKPDPRVPTWRAVNGYALGSREASDTQILRYLTAVDRSTARVRVATAGRSTDGRPIRYAIAGTPEHVAPAKLAALAGQARAVRDASLSPAAVASFARNSPAFVWIGGTVHGNEPSGGDADMQLLYDLAAGRTCRDQRRLHSVVAFILPMQNPDGRAAGTHVDAARFDLNRDWFAMTQPETQAKLAALETYPPVSFSDQHEESGTGFFFPPDADPVHHEVSSASLHAIDGVIAPRLQRAFRAAHIAFTNYDTYDLFFMGYGDSVPTTLFGAAGMTYEQGGESPYRVKVAHHFLAADTTLTAVATDRYALLRAWGKIWTQARSQGAAGTLQPNRVVQPGNTVRFPVPADRVYGYVIGPGHGADAAALAHRLVAQGVRVYRLAQPVDATDLRPYGDAAGGKATLAAGSYWIPSAQAAKHWVQAMLGEDPYVPFPYFYDVSSWSNPLLMGLDGGVLEEPLQPPAGATVAVAPGDAVAEPAAGAPAYSFAGGSEGALELAAQLARSDTVVRRPDGSFAFSAATPAAVQAALALAQGRNVPLTALDAPPADGTALRAPKVAVFADNSGDDSPGDLSAGWATWLLERRYGLSVDRVSAQDIATGKLDGYGALVVPDGGTSSSTAMLGALQAWVRGGGTLVAWRGRGVAVARAAGLTAVGTVPPPSGFTVPGAAMRVTLDPSDPVAAGESPESFVFNTGDPILAANGAPVVARYPAAARSFVSGYTVGSNALPGTPVATDEAAGTGRVVLFAFDPAFRGYTEGTERLLGNALLAPAPPAPGAGARVARPLNPAALALAGRPARDAVVEVGAEDEAALLRAARAAGVPAGFTLDRDLTTVTLRVPNPRGLEPARRPWTLRLPSALAAAGVRPLIAVF